MEASTPLYKAYEMEELLDIWFFHPAGLRIAKIAYRAGATPDQVTYLSMVFGIAGGLMLSSPRAATAGACVMVFSSVLDSADGQLARMRGGGTLLGRILDGMVGYLMFTSAYLGLSLYYLALHPRAYWIFFAAAAAGICSAVQSSLYDYYRTVFARLAVQGEIASGDRADDLGLFFRWIYGGYGLYQKIFARSHMRLLEYLSSRYAGGRLDETAKKAYMKENSGIIHGWNVLGDNMRLAAIAAAVVISRPELYFFFVIGPLSAVLAFMIFLQSRSDSKLMGDGGL